jgi:hypothetical protein
MFKRKVGLYWLDRTIISGAPESPTPEIPPEEPEDPTPVLNQIQPDSAGGWAVDLHAFGSDFVDGSVIMFDDTELTTTFLSVDELQCTVGALEPKTYDVTVHTGDKSSAPLPFLKY